ncbi:MAG TPA: hypothetical protein VJ201_06520 [Candidatus Babeliales bacterium]|nr:hypothetical protein [Candidatus Babeliales bacterium]
METTSHVKCQEPINFICPNGHKISIIPRIFEKKQVCAICSDRVRLTQEGYYNRIVESVKEVGWTVLSESYINRITPMRFMCSNEHIIVVAPRYLLDSIHCEKCDILKKYNNVRERAKKCGWTVMENESEYRTSRADIKFKCINNHVRSISLVGLESAPSCVKCAGKENPSKEDSYINIVSKAEAKGWKVLSTEYINGETKMYFQCPFGHVISMGSRAFLKHFSCAECSGLSLIKSERSFRGIIEKSGGKITGFFINNEIPVDCICPLKHACSPLPDNIQMGGGMCLECSQVCPEQSSEKFYKKVKELGWMHVEQYVSCQIRVKCLCEKGHACYPLPTDLVHGIGMCLKCSNTCCVKMEDRFKQHILNIGGTILGSYKGAHMPIKCLCPLGHVCHPRPAAILKQGQGMCLECAGCSPRAAEALFFKSCLEAGFQIVGTYEKSFQKIECLCISGHKRFLIPNYVQQKGISCKECDGYITHLELATRNALDILEYEYEEQCGHALLRRLRFDFKFKVNDTTYYIEADGEQHQKEMPYFHRDSGDFRNARQRDLIKNHFVRTQPNMRLIRLDHTMFKYQSNDQHTRSIANYIKNVINSLDNNIKIFGNRDIYDWLDDEPDLKYVEKYLVQ